MPAGNPSTAASAASAASASDDLTAVFDGVDAVSSHPTNHIKRQLDPAAARANEEDQGPPEPARKKRRLTQAELEAREAERDAAWAAAREARAARAARIAKDEAERNAAWLAGREAREARAIELAARASVNWSDYHLVTEGGYGR